VFLKIATQEGQDLEDDGIAHRVEDLVAHFAGDDDLLSAEDGEMLRDVGLLHAQFRDQRPGRELAAVQQFEDGDASGVAEGLEDAGFETADGIWHNATSYIGICADTYIA
jgi:hypothetical protein